MTALKAIFSRLYLGDPERGMQDIEALPPVGERRRGDRRQKIFPFYDRETRLRFAAQAAGFGTYDLDCLTGDNHWSPELKAIAGLPLDGASVPMEQMEALIHPDDRERVLERLQGSLDPAGSGELELENRLLRPDGQVRWLKTRGRTFFVGEGPRRQALATTGIVMDITAARAAEQEVLDSRAELSGLVESMIDAVISIDTEQRIVRFNPAACRMFRCAAEEAIGSNLERFIPERFRASHRDHISRFMDGGVTTRSMGVPGVFSGRRADGEEFPIEASISKVRVGGRWLLTVFLRDITERMEAQAALQRSKDELELRIAERTAELVRANEALERSNLELQQFAFIAAHDLQTPLRSITGFAQLLQKDYRGYLDTQADAWLEQLVRSTRRMHDVVQDILTYSRVESRGNTFRPTDLGQLFDDVVKTLEIPIREADARVTRGELPVVTGDRTQLAQVLQNLIDNGIKYRGAVPPRVHISAERWDEAWLVSVEDNGIGIAEKHLDLIFDIFRRLHSQREYPGTGIGLAVCRRVIHRHGGRIWAESTPGSGSIFRFTLPLRSEGTQ